MCPALLHGDIRTDKDRHFASMRCGDFMLSTHEGWGYRAMTANDPVRRYAKLQSSSEDKKYSGEIRVSNLCHSEPVILNLCQGYSAKVWNVAKNGDSIKWDSIFWQWIYRCHQIRFALDPNFGFLVSFGSELGAQIQVSDPGSDPRSELWWVWMVTAKKVWRAPRKKSVKQRRTFHPWWHKSGCFFRKEAHTTLFRVYLLWYYGSWVMW